jgi:subtilisin family serine protease
MKLQKSLLPSLITLLSVALAPWPTGVQAETAASKAQPTSAVAEAASSQFIAPAAQPPEPEWQESDDAKNPVQEASEVCTSCDEKPKDEEIVWETWLALPPEIKAKVDPRILAELQGAVIPAHLGGGPDQADIAPSRAKPLDKTRFLVHLTTKANLQPITWQTFATREARRTAVLNALVHTAQATQGPVRALLDARISQGKVTFYQSFYIFNGFAVEGDLDTLIKLAQRDDVERIVGNYPLLPLWKSEKAAASPVNDLGGLDPENWGIDLVDAERVWSELGITGQGAVVANIDTGVDYNHPALAGQYRGNLGGGTFNHNYNWFDPDPNLYPSGDLGPSRSAAPFDFGDHGTHTMGTMVGDGGAPGTQVGMAPGANWIALSLNEMSVTGSVADDIMGHKAFQWMLCPTDLSGNLVTADCSKAPDVVNNSWGSANPADDTFRPAIQALRAAGIAPVFAAGNPSAGLGSIGSPGSVPEAITVGATDINDNVASFSGRGPSFYAGEQKPELSAPGVNVKSTVPGGGYASYSGTSMAAPHVAGLIALMVSADLQDGIRDLNVDELERFMASTAVDLGSAGADHDYGYGRIDASNAVRWARSAGDLQGTVRDAGTGIPIAGATVTGVRTYPGDTFTNWTDASGYYSTTVPAGTYNITVEAWGYHSGNFSGQMVITGSLSIADFVLPPLPTATLSGRALSGATPVSGARVYVAARPSVSFTTGADGVYSLLLPVGSHELVVEATGYRILHQAVSVAAGGSSRDFNLTPAPTILLVDADAYAGWFLGWPVRNFFQVSLDQEDYLYDLWVVQYTTFNDTQVMPDGSPGYGIPSATTLGAYDLVIWAHGGGNWWPTGSTVDMGAADELMDYLDSGGRLIISGQDLGWADDGTTFYNDYLHADYTLNVAAGEGDTVSGQGFLAGLSLELTNASLRGYANGATGLWPDAVAPEDGAAYPVLAYDNGNGVAALAIDPCDASYRAVYLALGYENIGPRADNRDPAIAEVLDRSIDWVMGTKPTYRVNTTASPSRQTGAPGTTVTYDVQVLNTGALMDTFAVSLSGNVWPTRIYSGGGELTTPIVIPPCSVQDLTVEVDIPTAANIGDMDTVSVAATGHSSDSAAVTTVAFPFWQIETPMPTPRYRLAAASLPGDIYYYAIGGMGGPYWGDPMYHNERYNACAGQWEAMAPMPTARGNIGAAEIAGKIYVPGGYADGYYLDVLEVYDPATDTWSSGAPLPQALSGIAVAAYHGKLYTFGGHQGDAFTDKT